ncbi:hypothetical protein IWQ61_010214 [Dispira simplex]|nr:hypothetical protein IWQ61_010214 [Dispira simplex]
MDKPVREINRSTCINLSYFKEYLRELRKIDDNIMLRLNRTNTHSQAACADFLQQLAKAYTTREHAIKYCLDVIDEQLEAKSKSLGENPDDYVVKNSLYYDETKRRMIHNETTVEEIVRERSFRVFRDRCRFFDIPKEYQSVFDKHNSK